MIRNNVLVSYLIETRLLIFLHFTKRPYILSWWHRI